MGIGLKFEVSAVSACVTVGRVAAGIQKVARELMYRENMSHILSRGDYCESE